MDRSHRHKVPRLINVEPILFFYAIGVGFFITGFQALMMQKICIWLGHTRAECAHIINTVNETNPEHKELSMQIQSMSATYIMYFQVICNIPTILMAFSIGSWSDDYGRKNPIIIAVAGSAMGALILTIIAAKDAVPIQWSFAAAIINGCTGQMLAIFSCSFSMISDAEKDPARLTVRIGLAAGVISLGILTGSLLSGFILTQWPNDYTPIFGGVVIALTTSFLYTVFVARETVWMVKEERLAKAKKDAMLDPSAQSEEKMMEEEARYAQVEEKSSCFRKFRNVCSLDPVRASLKTLVSQRVGRRRTYLLVSLMCFFTMFAADAGLAAIVNLYVKSPPLLFPDSWYSYLVAVQTATMCIGLIILPALGKRLFNISDTTLIVFGLAITVAKMLLWALGRETWVVFFGTALGGFAAAYFTGFRAFLSKLVERSESGRLFAVVTASENIGPLLSSLIFNTIYGATVHWYAGFTFLICAGVIAVVLFIMSFVHIDIRFLHFDPVIKDEEATPKVETDEEKRIATYTD